MTAYQMDEGPRSTLLLRLLAEVGTNGLADRSLRDIARAIGTSHRMLTYHFGSRAGLVEALVRSVESAQREMLTTLAAKADNPDDLMLALWKQVSSVELRPFVRLFFECVALTGGAGLTDPWVALSTGIAEKFGMHDDETSIRLAVAVSRGLLIDVLADGDIEKGTRSIERFVAMWRQSRSR